MVHGAHARAPAVLWSSTADCGVMLTAYARGPHVRLSAPQATLMDNEAVGPSHGKHDCSGLGRVSLLLFCFINDPIEVLYPTTGWRLPDHCRLSKETSSYAAVRHETRGWPSK